MTLDNELMEPKGDGPPRRLRVVDWISIVPAIAICTGCAERFTVPVAALSTAMAQAHLQYQFDRHECKSTDLS
jgi:hypothetical protein